MEKKTEQVDCLVRIEETAFSAMKNRHCFIMTMHGTLKLHIEKQILSLSPNRSVLIRSSLDYQMTGEKSSPILCLSLDDKLLSLSEPFRLIDISPLFREILLEINRLGGLSRGSQREKSLTELLLHEIENKSDGSISIPLPSDERALKVYRLIVEDKHFDLSLDELSVKVGASKRTLERIFKNEVGMTFSKWRQLLRLQYSLALLDKGGTIANVSGEVGYGSSSAFIHSFKEYFGYPPGRYINGKKDL